MNNVKIDVPKYKEYIEQNASQKHFVAFRFLGDNFLTAMCQKVLLFKLMRNYFPAFNALLFISAESNYSDENKKSCG